MQLLVDNVEIWPTSPLYHEGDVICCLLQVSLRGIPRKFVVNGLKERKEATKSKKQQAGLFCPKRLQGASQAVQNMSTRELFSSRHNTNTSEGRPTQTVGVYHTVSPYFVVGQPCSHIYLLKAILVTPMHYSQGTL